VKNEGVAAVGVDQPELAAPAEAGDPRAGEALSEPCGKCAPKIASSKLNALDAAAEQHLFQAADSGFDFGKLRHGDDMAERPQRR
jgi:hypothetical protein